MSELLQKTAAKLGIPALNNSRGAVAIQNENVKLLAEEEFLAAANAQNPLKLYCNSENSINWIIRNLSHTDIPKYIEICKDKVKFRQMIRPLYPDFYFEEVDVRDLENLDISSLKMPFIIKPSVGFFSIGVYKITSEEDWQGSKRALLEDIESAKGLYPEEVLNSSKLMIEECIDGEEFAIDAYYNSSGKPVVLNILKHPFSSDTDVSDRVYYTSKEIIQTYLEPFQNVLERIGEIARFSNFPVHVEVRTDRYGKVIPIEFNPMRFAGWCVTDLAYFAYGINTYEYYFRDKEPEWSEILRDRDGKIFSMVLVDFPQGLLSKDVKSFDYTALANRFNKVLELRKIDYQKYPVFAFLFIETSSELNELETVLKMDYGAFIQG